MHHGDRAGHTPPPPPSFAEALSTSRAIGERPCHRQPLERRAEWRARQRALDASQSPRQRRARAPPRGICGNASGAVRRGGPTSSTSGALARPRIRRPIHHSSARTERQRMMVHQVQRPRGSNARRRGLALSVAGRGPAPTSGCPGSVKSKWASGCARGRRDERPGAPHAVTLDTSRLSLLPLPPPPPVPATATRAVRLSAYVTGTPPSVPSFSPHLHVAHAAMLIAPALSASPVGH